MASPLEQFTIKPIGPEISIAGMDVSFSNSAAFMVAAVVAISFLLIGGMRKKELVPGRWQSISELAYTFIADMVKENVGNEGRKYFPFVFALFMFILFGNLLGMLPYAFTFTSHIIVTISLALTVFIGVTLVAIIKHGTKFFGFFAPEGVPMWLMPLIIPIEIISYLSRPVSMSVRLFANMTAGHTMMKVFAGFVVTLGIIGGWAPFAISIALVGFEFLVAFLQAYIFTVLTCIYLNDAIHLH